MAWRYVGMLEKKARKGHGKIFEGSGINNEIECEGAEQLKQKQSIQDWVSKLICRDGGQG
jgi:hypothetical protein